MCCFVILIHNASFLIGLRVNETYDVPHASSQANSDHLLSQLFQGISIQPHTLPLLESLGTQTLIKFDTRFIPFQHSPIQPLSPNILHYSSQLLEQKLAVPARSILLSYKQILDEYARSAPPRAVIEKVEGKSRNCSVWVGHEEAACMARSKGGIGLKGLRRGELGWRCWGQGEREC